MKKSVYVIIALITLITATNKIYAQRTITVQEMDYTLELNILSEEDKTAELIKWTWSKDAENTEIINIPGKVTDNDGITYSIVSIGSTFFISGSKTGPHNDIVEINKLAYYMGKHILNIPNGVLYIQKNAFCGITFSEINLPSTLLEIGKSAFSMPSDIPWEWADNFILTHFTFDKRLIISNYVTEVIDRAFAYVTFKDVTFGKNVTTLQSRVFEEIKNVICCAKTPPMWTGDYTFMDGEYRFINYETHLMVPPGCKEIYEQNEKWKKVASIEEYEYYVNVEFDDMDIISHKILKGRLFKGQTRTLHPKITWLHEGSSERYRYWSSSDEEVATVDQNGIITAKNFGTATITFTIEDERGVPFDCNYEVTVTTSADVDMIESDDADTSIEVFALNGVKVGNTTDNLPAGLYIVKSAKEAKKIYIK